MAAVKTWEDYLKEAQKSGEVQKKQDIAASDAAYDSQLVQTADIYNAQINSAKGAYDSLYRENEVQKLINEREIAENMANLGLTDSGLNRTQQTAVQLSFNNQKNKLDNQRQAAVDSLASELAAAVASVRQQKASAANTIAQKYYESSVATANELYKNQQDNATKQYVSDNDLAGVMYKADTEAKTAAEKQLYDYLAKIYDADSSASSAKYKVDQELQYKREKDAAEASAASSHIIRTAGGLLSSDMQGSFADNGVDVYQNKAGDYIYVDNNSGKKTTLKAGVNPFTGTINKDTGHGVFNNGYQPNNINGTKVERTGETVPINGREQNVWQLEGSEVLRIRAQQAAKRGVTLPTPDYYVWDGSQNKYVPVEKVNGKWRVKG